MANYLLTPQKLMIGGGLGAIDGDTLTLLPYHHFATTAPAQHDPFLSPEALDLYITLFQITLLLLAAASGKSASGGGPPVMTELREFGKKMNTLFDVTIPQDVAWAFAAAQGTRGASVPTIIMMSSKEAGGAAPGRFVAPTFRPATGRARPENGTYGRQFRDTQPSLKPVTSSVRSAIVLSTPPPNPKELSQLEATFRSLLAQCSIDDLGFVDTAPLRNGNQLNVKVRFSDGTERTTEQLLRMHEKAWTVARRESGKKQAPLEGGIRSELRLLDVFRRITERRDLIPARDNVSVKTILPLDVPQVRLQRGSDQLKVVLQQMWAALAERGEQLIPRTVRSIMVQSKTGEREQVHTLLVIYWKSLKKEFSARGIALPDFGTRISETALDIMHYQLLGQVRPQQKMAGTVVTAPLPFEANDPLPEISTLRGALAVLYKFSQTSLMAGFDRFPHSPKGNTVLLFDPRTGVVLNYATVLVNAHYLLAKAAADPMMMLALRDVSIDAASVKNPDVARHRTPAEATRASLLAFVQKHQGLPEVVATTVKRRRGSDTQPVIQVGPLQSPLKATQPYVAASDISHDVATARFITRMTFAESLSDARAICGSMAANGLPEAKRVSEWLEGVTRGTKGSLEGALVELPLSEQLKPVVLPMVLNDVALRALSLTSTSSRTRARFESMMSSGDMALSSALRRYDYIVKFVVEEEARLDARPRRSPSSQWKISQSGSSTDPLSDTQTDFRMLIPPWSDLEVPAVFANAMRPMLSAPDMQLRVTDINRVFMSFMPLDEMPPVQKGRGAFATNEFVYNALTGRSGSMFDMPPMSKADLALRAQLSAIGDARQMLQFNEYWLGRGVKIARRDGTISPTLRFYMAINPARAAEVLTALNDLYDKWNPKSVKDIQFKMTNIPPELVRTDSALFFTDAANQGLWKDIVALRKAHPDYFRPVVGPLGTANFRDGNGQPMGISVAEAPNRVTESRNSVLGNLNTQGVRDYRTFIAQGVPFTPEELLRATAYYLQKGGIDLERPAFYSGTSQRAPGWVTFAEVYRQTDQYRGE